MKTLILNTTGLVRSSMTAHRIEMALLSVMCYIVLL